MSDVSFDEEQNLTRYAPVSSAPKRGGVAGLIIRLGLAKDERQANTVMIAIIVVAFICIALIWIPKGRHTPSPAATIPAPQVPQ